MHLLIFDQLLKIFQNAENDKQYFDLIYFNNQQLMKNVRFYEIYFCYSQLKAQLPMLLNYCSIGGAAAG
ncbi:hypothetical protein T06_1601 [Trichinella sp. T6]|nr:hypothetical protein T06_1601 [Trichinella sp. T6]